MLGTFQALTIAILALLPGALYVWAFERLVGAWGINLSDRVLRFVGVSAIFHALIAPLSYRIWIDYVRSGRVYTGRVPLVTWLIPLLYVGIPVAAGSLVGWGTRRAYSWAELFTGPEPAPRAWDYMFGLRREGWIRLRLKSGLWVGGAFAERADGIASYVAGYPEEQDIFLAEAAAVDPDTGVFLHDERGSRLLTGRGMLVRWEEVEYLEFIEAEGDPNEER